MSKAKTKEPDRLFMTQVQYAKYKGVSRQAINKHVKAGKIKLTKDRKVDVAQADFALGETVERVPVKDDTPASGKLTDAKVVTEGYTARLKQLQYERLVDSLLARKDVEDSMELAAEVIVREVDRLPSMTDELATAFTRDGVKGLRRGLADLAQDLRRSIAEALVLIEAESEQEDEAA